MALSYRISRRASYGAFKVECLEACRCERIKSVFAKRLAPYPTVDTNADLTTNEHYRESEEIDKHTDHGDHGDDNVLRRREAGGGQLHALNHPPPGRLGAQRGAARAFRELDAIAGREQRAHRRPQHVVPRRAHERVTVNRERTNEEK